MRWQNKSTKKPRVDIVIELNDYGREAYHHDCEADASERDSRVPGQESPDQMRAALLNDPR